VSRKIDLSGMDFGRWRVKARAADPRKWVCECQCGVVNMGSCPDGHSLGREDNEGHYEPGNCRWETDEEQNGNRRNCVRLTLGEETHGIKEWSEITGISYGAIWQRLNAGWSPEEALTTPQRRRKPR
jgi:hypothetical protein